MDIYDTGGLQTARSIGRNHKSSHRLPTLNAPWTSTDASVKDEGWCNGVGGRSGRLEEGRTTKRDNENREKNV
jgi:hypothetical protein